MRERRVAWRARARPRVAREARRGAESTTTRTAPDQRLPEKSRSIDLIGRADDATTGIFDDRRRRRRGRRTRERARVRRHGRAEDEMVRRGGGRAEARREEVRAGEVAAHPEGRRPRQDAQSALQRRPEGASRSIYAATPRLLLASPLARLSSSASADAIAPADPRAPRLSQDKWRNMYPNNGSSEYTVRAATAPLPSSLRSSRDRRRRRVDAAAAAAAALASAARPPAARSPPGLARPRASGGASLRFAIGERTPRRRRARRRRRVSLFSERSTRFLSGRADALTAPSNPPLLVPAPTRAGRRR